MHNADCLFCRIIRKEIPAKVAAENESVFAFYDVNPQAPVHILIIPKAHFASVNDLNDNLSSYLAPMTMMAKELAAQNGIADSGYRIVMNTGKEAGQSVFHLHMHLLGGRHMAWPPG